MNKNKIKRGKGFWKFNNKLLYDREYVNLIKETVIESKKNLNHYADKGLVSELVKLKIRSVSIPYCIKKIKKITSFKNNLLKEINLLQVELNKNPSINNLERLNTSKHELEQIEKHEAHGKVLRNKQIWTEDGEKNSKFFLNLEKRNYCNKHITSLEVDGKIIKDQHNISKAQTNIYQNIYSEKLYSSDKSYKDSLNNFFINNKTKILTNMEQDSCGYCITEKEILNSLKQLHNDKTPGTDGLPPEFYK